jgi:hypothetical protein
MHASEAIAPAPPRAAGPVRLRGPSLLRRIADFLAARRRAADAAARDDEFKRSRAPQDDLCRRLFIEFYG